MSPQVFDVLLPQLGMGMSEGTVVEWSVAEGARVSRDEPLASIENEKTVTELPAPRAGFVHLVAKVGQNLPIETLIARIAATESDYRAMLGQPEPQATAPARSATAPAATPTAAANDVLATALGAAPPMAPSGPRRIRASWWVQALARDHSIDLAAITGSGPRGRIVKRDILPYLEKRGDGRLAAPAAAAIATPKVPEMLRRQTSVADADSTSLRTAKAKIPLTGIRRTIAERMVRASTEAAQTFVFFDVDLEELLQTRKRIDSKLEAGESKITAMAYYAKAVALACQRVPIANATLEDGEITLWNEVNVGIAVALPGASGFDSSLMVPVVHGAESLGILALSRRIREQVQKARDGKLKPADMAGGTITISSNAGMFPGMWVYSTPLLNLPQAIIFQPGNAVKRPVVIDDQIVVRTVLPCSVTFDHRCLDGEPTAHFIRELTGFLTHPDTMLM